MELDDDPGLFEPGVDGRVWARKVGLERREVRSSLESVELAESVPSSPSSLSLVKAPPIKPTPTPEEVLNTPVFPKYIRFGRISGDPGVDPALSLAESEGERGCVGWVKYVGMGTVTGYQE
jgi:hypothetical protein